MSTIKFKRLRLVILPTLLLSLLMTIPASGLYENGSGHGINSNMVTQYVDSYPEIAADRLALSTDYEKVLENNALTIYYRDKDAQVRIWDKKAGYLWGGLPTDDSEGLISAWRGMAASVFTIEYVNEVNNGKVLSIADGKVEKTMKVNGNRMEISFTYTDLKISGKVYLELTEDKLAAGFTASDFKEEDEFLITNAYLLPFLGTTVGDELPGYMFIPDGPGALVRFKKPTHYLSPYTAKIYGKDYAIDQIYDFDDSSSNRPTDYRTDEKKALVPVFGMSHGEQYAYFGHVTKGAEYTSIVCYPSGVITDYNWVTAAYHFRQKYLQPVDRSGASVYTARHPKNPIDVRVEYTFLSGSDANYAGMARSYRNDLIKTGALPTAEMVDTKLPTRVELIGYDVKKRFIFSTVFPVTTAIQAEEIVQELFDMSIQPTIVYQGYQKGGANGSSLKTISSIDGFGALGRLRDKVVNGGGRFYLQDRSMSGTRRQIKNNFALHMSLSPVKTILADKTILFPDTFFLNPVTAAENLSSKLEKYAKEGFTSLSLWDYTNVLYADNSDKYKVSRPNALSQLQAPLANDVNFKFAGYSSYSAMWQYTNELFDMPVYSSRLMFETDTVPFISMVLKGSIDCYGPSVNQSFYTDVDILKMVEYGLYPSFILTHTANKNLLNTRLSTYYSTQYKDWLPYIEEVSDFIEDGLLAVEGASIIDHYSAAEGVMCTVYSNGYSIYVNYNQKSVAVEDIIVPPRNYIVRVR